MLWWQEKAGYYLLSDFTSQVISSLREELLNGSTNRGDKRTPATVNRYLAALSHVMNVAVNEWEWIEVNPVMKIKKHTEGQGRTRYLDDDERNALLNASKESSNKQLYHGIIK